MATKCKILLLGATCLVYFPDQSSPEELAGYSFVFSVASWPDVTMIVVGTVSFF